MQIRLFVPSEIDRTTGSHAYERRMLGALRRAGHDAEAFEIDGEQAAGVAWQALPDVAVPLIDSRCLMAFQPLRAALVARAAFVLAHHPTVLEPGLSPEAHARLSAAEAELLPVLPRIIVTSVAVRARLTEAFGVPGSQMTVVAPGSDAASRATGATGASCEILAVGALVPRKGYDVLLRALARLSDLDWRLTIVGTTLRHPVHAGALQTLAEELDIAPRVRFAGRIDDAALDELWQRTDIFALATRWEATPGVTADALRRGIPVVVNDAGAAGALITPLTGAAVAGGDFEMFSKTLRRLIFDTDLRAEMAEAAWQAGAALPTWDQQAALLLAALQRPAAA